MLRRLLRREVRHGWLWPAIVGAGLVVAVLVVGWQVYETGQDSEIREGAVVRGVDIGGLEPEEAVTALEPVVQEVAETTVELQFIELQFQNQSITIPATEFTAAELGISLDTEKTLAEADNPPPPVVRPAAWLFDLFASREVSPAVTTDLGTLADTVDPYTDPETPRIEFVDGAFRPVLQTDVPVPDMELLAERLEEAVLQNVGGRAVVEVPIRGMEPADPIAVALASALATKANEITEGGVLLQLEGTTETFAIGELALRQFIILEGEQHDTHLALDPRIADTLTSLFVGIGGDGLPATIGLDDAGAVTISAGEPGFKCCDAAATDVLLAGMIDNQPVIILPAAPAPHPQGREWAESLGIFQVVGEFTTRFRPGQDRIINIARISELTRGAIIEPGQRFSVNGFVGPRTVNKGFVPAAMILDGVFVDSVGGGISQYATTLFNAAFFAGLDFVDYQSHTIYLSRYPYGREATVSYPAPDLVLENNTPHGVMLWPTTGDDSITVRLYSTPWVLAEQTDQWTRTVGTTCTRVTTERTRTYLEDGRTETDTVWAQYRPEGLKCDGTPSVTTTTTTTTPIMPPEGSEDQGGEEAGWEQGETGTDLADPDSGQQPGDTVGETGAPQSGVSPSTTIPDES
ncbi:MAG: VanW family protein [Acidimicrobiia bacterium]|nr:VanW family protein [Acidimicrobiia bacterium]